MQEPQGTTWHRQELRRNSPRYEYRGTYVVACRCREKCRLLSEDHLKGTRDGSRGTDRFAQRAPPRAPTALLTFDHDGNVVDEHEDVALAYRDT